MPTKIERIRKQDDTKIQMIVLGPNGAVEFHNKEYSDGYNVCGVEYHRRKPANYMKDMEPILHCDILKGPCWHDGTTLYAEEHLLPLYKNGYEDMLWNYLETLYREQFERLAYSYENISTSTE